MNTDKEFIHLIFFKYLMIIHFLNKIKDMKKIY